MKLTRKTALFLALTLSASLLSGCGGGDTNTPTGGGKDNVETITLRASSPTDPGTGWLKVKRNLQKSRKISTLHKRGGRILCVFTTK